MTTALLALTTAALFGVADYLGGAASRKASAFAVTAVAHAVGGAGIAVALVLAGGALDARELVVGAIAGLSGGLGVVALYAALAAGRMGVVAATTAALSGSLPAAFDLLRGARPSLPSLLGMALALVAIVVVSLAEDDTAAEAEHLALTGRGPRWLVLSLLSGAGFAGAFIAFSFTAEESGLWPVLAARVTSVAVVGALALLRRRPGALPRAVLPAVLAIGVLDTAANVSMITSVRIGPLAVASVLGSLYPIVTALLAWALLGERLKPMQRSGVALALVAVVLTAMT